MNEAKGTGKVTAVTPLMQDGQHATWQAKDGTTMYKFTVTVTEDGSNMVYTGVANAKSATTPYKVNDTVEFTYTPDQYGGKMKASKPREQRGTKKMSPEQELAINRQVSVEVAIAMLGTIKEGVTPGVEIEVAETFVDWIVGNSANNDVRAVSNALRRGCEAYVAGIYTKQEGLKASTIVMNLAASYLAYYFKK